MLSHTASNLGPTLQAERIEALDVLRGVAVMGILVMNIQSFSMIDTAYWNPSSYGDLTGGNHRVWLLSHVLTDQKFMTIFSMLFGAGIVLMSARREAAALPPAGVHYRRMVILLLFGTLHGYLLWWGDILNHYAMCGLLVYLLRRWRPGWLLVTGIGAITVPAVISALFGWALPYLPLEVVEEFKMQWAPPADAVAQQVATYQGSWVHQMGHRAPMMFGVQTLGLMFAVMWRAGGVMLLGMALFKWGVLSAKRSVVTYAVIVVGGAGLGIPVILYGVRQNVAAQWDMNYSFFLGGQYNYWASILVALAWIGLVMLLCKRRGTPWLTRPLAAAGQMAFTNYILQSVICTTIFYGHGFGLFGQIERLGQISIVVVVCVFQLIISPVWLHYFRFGPLEWLWRSLTYRQLQPMMRIEPGQGGTVASSIGPA